MQSKKTEILFLVPYPLQVAPSQRFRVELFFPELDKAGIPYRVQSFMDEKTWSDLYRKGGYWSKFRGVVKGYARRWKLILFSLSRYDYVFIHREAAPLGPPLFEWIISKVYRKKIIYDFDDAIWIPNTSRENKLVAWFKACWKIKYICRWSYTVVGGNDYLCAFARQYNQQVIRIPTCVDTIHHHNRLKDQYTDKVVIGWTGSQSTLKFLKIINPVLEELGESAEILIIADQPPSFPMPPYRFLKWNEQTETEDLLQMNIGLMPLETDPWCEGKCGFKLVQYLSLGIPALATPIGVNAKIIEQGRNGFLCKDPGEWKEALLTLISDPGLREKMGKAGREKVINEYSIQSQATVFLQLFS